MSVKHFKSLIASTILLAASGIASASITVNQTFNLESGAVFNGTLTFNDNYQGLIGTDGWIMGGVNEYSEHLTWTFRQGEGQANPQDSDAGGNYTDWLMNGVEDSYSFYLGVSWNTDAETGSLVWDFTQPASNNGWDEANDPIISGTTSTVPVPGSVWLMGSAIVGFLGISRRKIA